MHASFVFANAPPRKTHTNDNVVFQIKFTDGLRATFGFYSHSLLSIQNSFKKIFLLFFTAFYPDVRLMTSFVNTTILVFDVQHILNPRCHSYLSHSSHDILLLLQIDNDEYAHSSSCFSDESGNSLVCKKSKLMKTLIFSFSLCSFQDSP